VKDALAKAKEEVDTENDSVIVLADENWHPGVIGIVASRLTEEYNMPAILIALDGDKGKGSGRSVEGFNLFEAITDAGEYLIDFGGHEAACGVKVETGKVDDFRKKMNEVAHKHFYKEEDHVPELKIDLNLPFSHVGVKLINELGMLMPHGPGNIEPVFCTNGLKVKNRPTYIEKNKNKIGFKFFANCGSLTYEAVTFRMKAIDRPSMGDTIDLAYTPSIYTRRGIDSIQLNIKDLRILE
ncbi:MAG: DHHA1 domain-containing protein, partial [Candidatus Tantalella remota]|nr:DHHA1 domain-containing protein [Candidatus Tantalella remota]